jgi:hypothetical protein
MHIYQLYYILLIKLQAYLSILLYFINKIAGISLGFTVFYKLLNACYGIFLQQFVLIISILI